jgi:NAD+ kinase
VFDDHFALNDVVVTRGALSRIVELAVEIGGQPAMRVRADGLIVASPTGSTAYNLAAGGPILHPHPAVDALLLTPIAPHMLTNRPIVIPASAEVRISPAAHGRDEVFVTLDGQSGHAVETDDVICVARSARPLRLVQAATRSYFDVLRQKLKWSQ